MMQRPNKPREQLPEHEELLFDYAQRLRQHTVGRRAVWVHLSKLQPYNRREHHLRVAAGAFDQLLRRFDGQCFRMKNGDIVVLLKDAPTAELDQVVMKLRYLFSEDPLAYGDSEDADNPFSTVYDMQRDYQAFFDAASDRLEELRGQADREAVQDMGVAAPAPAPGEPMDPARLARLESMLMSADVSGQIRRQAACAIVPGQRMKPVFNELFVSIDELRRRIMPEVEIASNRWLFQHLTELLDRRVLRVLPALEAQVPLATSLNLNVSTILSEDFQVFDREVRQRARKSFVVEVQPIDAFSDIGAFYFARDYLHERGYKLTLDGVNYLGLPLLRRAELGVDFIKVLWSHDAVLDQPPGRRQAFAQAIRDAGAARVVLCRCDSETAVNFGLEVGINLFQGRHVDRLLTAK